MSSNNSPKTPNNSAVHTPIEKPSSPKPSRKANTGRDKEIIYSLEEWITNAHSTLRFPMKILTVFTMILLGTFIETAPRKSLEFLDSYVSLSLLFVLPFAFVYYFDWPTGLLVATIVVIVCARINKHEQEEEGFSGTSEMTLVSDSTRWFVEKALGETPLGTVSKEVDQVKYKNNDSKTNSSTSMSNSRSSSGTK
jgi:hypothetical protein